MSWIVAIAALMSAGSSERVDRLPGGVHRRNADAHLVAAVVRRNVRVALARVGQVATRRIRAADEAVHDDVEVAMRGVAVLVRRNLVPAAEDVRLGRLDLDVGQDADLLELRRDQGDRVGAVLAGRGAVLDLELLAALGPDAIGAGGPAERVEAAAAPVGSAAGGAGSCLKNQSSGETKDGGTSDRAVHRPGDHGVHVDRPS